MKLDPKAISRALNIAKRIGENIDPGFGGVNFPKVGTGVPLVRKSGGRTGYSDGGSQGDPRLGQQHAEPEPDYSAPDSYMNMYSKAADVASKLPMKQASPEQWKATLLNKGVKPAELKWSEFDRRLGDKPTVSREEVARHFDIYQPDIHKTELRGPDTKYSAHTLPGGKEYREVLLHEANPDETRHLSSHWTQVGGNYNPWDDTDEPEDIPDVYVHARLKDRETPDRKKVLHAEELQSDWGQEGRKKSDGTGGFRDPDWRKVRQDTEAQDRFKDYIRDLSQRTGMHIEPERPYPDIYDAARKTGELEQVFEHGRNVKAEREANLRRLNVPVEGPYVGSTNDWVDLGLKHLLSHAAANGHEHLAWTPGDMQATHYREDNETKQAARVKGMQKFYNEIVPNRLLKLARMHDPEARLGTVQTKEPERASSDPRGSYTLPSLEITPRMRESILKHGFSAYASGGSVEGYEDGGTPEPHPLTNPVYHGTKGESVSSPMASGFNMEMFDAQHPSLDYNAENVTALALGPHVARDPNISGDYRFTTGEEHKEGGRKPLYAQGKVMMLNTFPDEKFFPVKQKLNDDGSPIRFREDNDDNAVYNTVYADVFRHNPKLAHEVLTGHGYDPETASEYVKGFQSGKPFADPYMGSSRFPYRDIEHFLSSHRTLKPGERNIKKVVKDFRKRMRDRGYVGLSYINTDDDETANAEDRKCYIVFPQRDKQTGWYPLRMKHAAYDPQEKASSVLTRADGGETDAPMAMSAARENVPGITVSPRPGKMGGYPVREGTMDEHEPWTYAAEPGEHMPSPPPIQEPVYNSPRLDRLHRLTAPIFKSKGFNDLVYDLTGLRNLKVSPIHGTWKGEAEPSFHISHPDLTAEHVSKLAPLLGFGFQQDAVVHHHHNADQQGDGIPAYYIGKGSKLSPKDLQRITEAAQKEGLDYSQTSDGRGVKFLHFGDDGEDLDRFDRSVDNIANASGLPHRHIVKTSGDLQNAQDYLPAIFGSVGGAGEGEGMDSRPARSPHLFGRIVDHVLAPYAKAVASEGYRISPERLAETYGLTPEETEKVRTAMLPKGSADRTTVPLMNGEEPLDVRPTGANGKANVGDVLFALQNRAARHGTINPGDHSPQAMDRIASDVAKEVKYHTDTAGKSAIGWYDSALKKAMSQYEDHFPELKNNKDAQAAFKAILGITSQGQDVFQNSGHTIRAYDLLRKGVPIPDVVKKLRGTFGDKTRAIETNLMKLHDLSQKAGGYDALSNVLNKKMSVSDWNKYLKNNPSLHFDGEPLGMKGGSNQKVTGWTVFGPKIGSFINNLNGDYSTLTADLWFSRTWNRLLGHNFIHTPEVEAKQYRDFRDALVAEHAHHNPDEALPEASPYKTSAGKVKMDTSGRPQPWLHGNDVGSLGRDEMDSLVNDPEKMLSLAQQANDLYRKGGYKGKSDLRRRAKNWIENRENPVAAPRGDLERDFQQNTIEKAQKKLKKQGLDISVADIQAALWFHEKDLFNKLGVASEKAKPADYSDAAAKMLAQYAANRPAPRPKKYIGGGLTSRAPLHVPKDAVERALLIARKMRYS